MILINFLFCNVLADTIEIFNNSTINYIYSQHPNNYIAIHYGHNLNGILKIEKVIVSLLKDNNTLQSVTTYSNYYSGNVSTVLQLPYYKEDNFTVTITGVGKYFEVSSGQFVSMNTTNIIDVVTSGLNGLLVSSSITKYISPLIYLFLL